VSRVRLEFGLRLTHDGRAEFIREFELEDAPEQFLRLTQ
jgi:hypothetical protein